MKGIKYEDMSAQQLRIAIAKLGIDESDLVSALEDAAAAATAALLLDEFGLVDDNATTTGEVARPRRRGSKSSSTSASADNGVPKRRRGRPPGQSAVRGKRIPITPEQLASRVLQGKDLGAIRRVPATKRAKYKSIASGPGGRAAAIKAIQADYPS